MFECEVVAKEEIADNLYQHIHHADILRMFEQGRCAFLQTIGFSNESFIARGIFPVVASVNIRYLREVRPGTYVVTCEKGRCVGKSLFVHQRLFNKRRKIVADAEVECVLMDGASRRGVTPEAAFERAFTSSALGLPFFCTMLQLLMTP